MEKQHILFRSEMALRGHLQQAREGRFGSGENVLFLHSGGAGGLFAVIM